MQELKGGQTGPGGEEPGIEDADVGDRNARSGRLTVTVFLKTGITRCVVRYTSRSDGKMATTTITTTTKGLTTEETDTTNSAALSTMAASLALNNRVYSLDDFETVATVGTGTFGRVFLVKDKKTRDFFALKAMKIPDVIRLKQEQHVHNEKEVLTEVNHPFLIRLFWTHHDERFLYMLIDYVPGGELFSYLRNRGRFSNSTGLFYSAEIVCAIEYLHSKEIVYRDLKPENILLDREGHIRLTDFGFAKKLSDRTWTLCGTPEYLAPEVIQSKGHGRAVDWWALGVLIFEMLSGYPPFFDDNPFGIYQKILAGKLEFPRHLDFYVKDLIKKFLVIDRARRLGNMKLSLDVLYIRQNGADDVKKHRWFKTIDWDAVPNRKLKPPIVPKVSHEGDTSNFEDYPEDEWKKESPVSPKDLEIFKNF
ncbi:cAMP-dependent protein kinase catalytic subunit PRKX [Bagarius yarrelli]|uniref:cAMP-dependent protein kinase catalytic subunit PRKX n=1 Tax=Bagarius yarrelli TaxID=175774 RepID=A0A556TKW8_BAGYA|nr:cAMP-dependent protein kinase catalytic subunit PRKX [Bagarius yarrelli]